MERSSFLYTVVRIIAKFIFFLIYRIEIDEEGTLPQNGPLIILPKHQYWTDIPLVSITLRPMLYFIAKRELFRFPLIRDFLLLLGGIPLDRKSTIKSLESFKKILKLLRVGEKIVIFPEGTYFRNELGPPKTGLLQMILRYQEDMNHDIPFIPMGIRYGERTGWRRIVEIRIGRPLYSKKGADSLVLINKAMYEIGRLSGFYAK